jgi:hypothetical protein
MTKIASIMFVLAGLSFANVTAASAQTLYDYPWCAAYNRDVKNCGFVTFAQCLATIRGIGGFCEPNPFYRPRTVIRRIPRRS